MLTANDWVSRLNFEARQIIRCPDSPPALQLTGEVRRYDFYTRFGAPWRSEYIHQLNLNNHKS